jgi:hypothetical protein
LSADDAAVVETHLTDCSRCRAECELQAQIHDTIRDEDSVAFATEGSYRKLAERIESSSAGPKSQPASRSRRIVMGLAAALAVESFALVAWGAWSWMDHRPVDARYVTLSSGGGAAAAHGTLVRVVFADSVALADVEKLLRATEARVVDGPTERGVYTIEMKGASELSADRLRALQGSELVRFAEPVMAGASGAQ